MLKMFSMKANALQMEIEEVLLKLSGMTPETDEFKKVTENLKTLYEIKALDKGLKIKPESWLLVGGSLLGTLMILIYEETGTIRSKALNSLLLRLRV